MKNIVVAGCGHGGLAVAGLLAKAGYTVNVFEKQPKDKVPHDWTDIFNINSLTFAGIPLPPKDKFTEKVAMTFVNPSKTCHIETVVPEGYMEMKMERKDIFEHLLDFAETSGAKVHFSSEIIAPLVKDNTVCGIKLKDKDITADLVIDACGMKSPVRYNLPKEYNIVKEFKEGEKFYIYRAFHERVDADTSKYKYKVYLFHCNEIGISWVADENEYIDILIGRVKPLTKEKIEQAHKDLKHDNPCLGDKVLRGGQMVELTIRRPLPLFVGNNYAAVGDSAGMAVPMIGSGIANSIEAGKLLFDTIAENKDGDYSIKNLWSYQAKYLNRKSSHAGVDVLKQRLFKCTKEEADFAFEKGVINTSDLSSVAAGKDFELTLGTAFTKARKGISDLPLLLSFASALNSSKKMAAHAKAIPTEYNAKKVEAWMNKYNKF